MPMRQFAEPPRIVCRQQVGHCLAHIPQEALGNLDTLHDAPCYHGQEGQGIVATQPLKLLAELGRPVLRAGFPTVNVRRHERLAHERF